jgi:DNA-binding response OmpR family regulator
MKKILLIDDAPEADATTAELLAQEGYQVTRARSSGEVRAMIQKDRPDLVLLEGKRPDRPGWDVAQELSGGVDTQGIPVVLFAELGEADPGEGPESVPGIRRIIYKPCRPRTFHEGIAHVLRYGR